MPIRIKLLLALSILALIAPLSSAMIWSYARDQSRTLETANERLIKVAERSGVLIEQAKDLHFRLVQVQQNLTDVAATRGTEDDGSVGRAEENARQFGRLLSDIRDNADALKLTQVSGVLSRIGEQFEACYAVGQEMMATYRAHDTARGYGLMRNFDACVEEIGVEIDALSSEGKLKFSSHFADMAAEMANVADGARRLVILVVATSALSLAVIGLLAFLLHSNILRPLYAMARVMKQLAAGRDDVDVPDVERGDEVGEFAHALRVFKNSQGVKRSVDMLRSMLNRMPVGVLLCARDGRIEFANAYARNMFEMRAADATGFRIVQFLPAITAADDPELELAEALDQGQYLLSRPLDGREFKSEVQVSAMDDGRYVWTIRDATRRIEAEKRREQLEVELRAAQKLESLGTMAGGIAHELNTPVQFVTDNMNFLKGALADQVAALEAYRAKVPADVAQDLDGTYDLQYISEEGPQAIQQSLDGLSRISEIVLAIKRFSYPSGSGMRENDFNEIVRTAVTVSRNQWKYVAECELDLDPALPLIVSNAGELNQMMLNLIVNAAHAIEDKKEPGEKGYIKISTRAADNGIACVVSDNGIGIKPENCDKIFDLFFTTKAPGRGTGQGLSLVHSIVTRSHQGKISLGSEIGKGTSFTIWLPLAPKEKEAVAAAAATPPAPAR